MKKHYKSIEVVWLICVCVFYFLYNLPGVPEYGNSVSALVHGAVTIVLIWVGIYAGLNAIYKYHPPKDKASSSAQKAENNQKQEGNER